MNAVFECYSFFEVLASLYFHITRQSHLGERIGISINVSYLDMGFIAHGIITIH
jgi:hypothetical protein